MDEEFNVGDVVVEIGNEHQQMTIIQYPYSFTNGLLANALGGNARGGFTTIVYNDRAKCRWTDRDGDHEAVFFLTSLIKVENQE